MTFFPLFTKALKHRRVSPQFKQPAREENDKEGLFKLSRFIHCQVDLFRSKI